MASREYSYNITIEGGKRVVIDGIKRVTELTAGRITVLIGRELLDVMGDGLKIEEIGASIVSIVGAIEGVTKHA